jgi:SAM-dependent methyltransferase
LDIGCNWGRWTIAASQAGHESVGIDPQLGAVLAAKRVAASLDTAARFVVADGRYLPFPDEAFDYVWSYSVLQHFAMRDVEATLDESRRVVRLSGLLRIQMANCLGIRSMMHLLKRRGKQPQNFDVRYWRPRRLKLLFEKHVGRTALTPDCYLGLGLQWSDFRRMTTIGKAALIGSEALRSASKVLPPLALLADSLFCTATPRSHEGAADLHDA